ncbi:MAG: DUF1116 domain-containing protein [Candidatus Nanopelagicales bacterium]
MSHVAATGPPALPTEVDVINVGLQLFAGAVAAQGRPVVHVDWQIPAGGDPELVGALRRLYGPMTEGIDRANAEVLHRLDTGVPMLTRICPAAEAVQGLVGKVLLHPGPALEWPDVCDPLRRSMRAAVVAEGWADHPVQADALLESGAVTLSPANEAGVVVPMAAVVTPTTPGWVVELAAGTVTTFAPLGQGPGDVAWFGKDTAGAIARLVMLREAAAPVLSQAVRESGPVDVLSLAAQAVAMGDDVHVRTQAATNLLLRHWLPALVAVDHPRRVEVARALSDNHLLFLTLAMAAARALAGWAAAVPGSSVVTGMCRNGTEFGIRVGDNRHWFRAPAPMVGNALYHPGHGPADGAPDIGDSAVLELVGLGGAAAAGSPAVAQLVGGSAAAEEMTAEMDRVCVGRSTRFTLPTRGGQGTPLAVDVRAVVEHGIAPKVTTGILHAADGSGQIGVGVAVAPLEPFRSALVALDQRPTGA